MNYEPQERFATFEYLLQKGAKISPGALLSLLIIRGGREQLIQSTIRAGADIHAYSYLMGGRNSYNCISPLQAAAFVGKEQLVRQLIGLGAKVDERPLPKGAQTAMQCVLMWQAISSDESLRKLRIVRLLLDHGAAVNGSPGGYSGHTALQSAAAFGYLDVAILFLRHRADINEASKDGYYALDVAARWSRIDLVQFLLNANAVSCRPGRTGYDGAIANALRGYHFTVAESLEKHVENNSKWGILDRALPFRQKNREDMIYIGVEFRCSGKHCFKIVLDVACY